MNQLVGRNEKGELFLALVLEPGNMNLLRQGRPIIKRIEEFFPSGIPRKLELLIFFSETPLADAKEFSAMSKITFDERTHKIAKLRPHCPECKSTVEQLGIWRNESPMVLTFCPQCGCVFGMAPSEGVAQLPRCEPPLT